VPKARRVTFTLDLPKVTQSVALGRAAISGMLPALATAAAASPDFRNSRREWGLIGASQKPGLRGASP
jgi:hypothetical protein